MKRWLLTAVLGLLLTACNLAVPQVTPTVAPTLTPSQTQLIPSTPTLTLSATATIPASATLTASLTASPTDEPTQTPSATFTETLPPTATATPSETLTPSDTPTGTPPPSETPSPTLPPSDTAAPSETPSPTLMPSDTVTGTSSPTLVPSDTVTPTETLTASATRTFTAAPSATPSPTNTTAPVVLVPSPRPTLTLMPTNTIPPSFTPLPTPSPLPLPGTPLFPTATLTVAPVGVREPTAEQVTAAPGTLPAPVTPAEVPDTAAPPSATALVLPTELPAFSTVFPTGLPTFALVPDLIPLDPQTRAFALLASGEGVSGADVPFPFGATTFARHPLDPNRYAVVDTRGLLYLFNGGLAENQGALLSTSPFALPEPLTREDNNAIVTQVAWSPDGRTLAFLIDAERDDRDGIWIMPDGQNARQIFRECPPPQLERGLCTVIIGGEPSRYNSLHFEWNPNSTSLLVTLDLPEESRRALTAVPLDNPAENLPPILRYDYAAWSQDGNRVLVSGGAARDNRAALRWVDPNSDAQQIIFDASAAGLWMQNAVERPGGQIVALGGAAGSTGGVSLYDAAGQALTQPIGTTPPERVTWSPDRSAVLVVTAEVDGLGQVVRRYFVAEVSGNVTEITASVAGALAVEWLAVPPPDLVPTALPSPTAGVPAEITIAPVGEVAPVGVAATPQSAYGIRIEQQVQVHAPAGVILRAQPSTFANEVALMVYGEWVMVVSGPVQAEGLVWWQVRQPRTGETGWAAEAVGGQQLLSTEAL